MSTDGSQLRTLTHKWLNRLAPLLLLLAVAWLCWNIARVAWLFLAPPHAPNLPTLPMQVNQNTQKIQANAQSFNIFTTPNKTQPQTIAKKAPSNIALKGVMTANPTANSSALISINNQIKNYRVGAKLEGTNYTLESVDWNEVSLRDTQNSLTTINMNTPLQINQDSNTFSTGAHGTKSNVRSNNKGNNKKINNLNSQSNNRIPHNTRNSFPNNATQSNKKTTATNKPNISNSAKNKASSAQQTIQEIKKNPTKYMNKMGVQASSEGYLVTNAMPASIRNKASLKAGDRIMSVNGQKVGSNPNADAQLLEQVQKTGKASIQVKRGERIFTFNTNF